MCNNISVIVLYLAVAGGLSHRGVIITAKIHNISLVLVTEVSQLKRYCSGNIGHTLLVSPGYLTLTLMMMTLIASDFNAHIHSIDGVWF